MPRVLQLVHGFPPRENAGTEQYAARLAAALPGRGWEVHTLAATQAPGRPMYAVEEAPGLTRVVNNAPFAGLRRGGEDAAIEAVIAERIARFRPDVIHLQHPASLTTRIPGRVPVVWTLHDAWAWCPAGGQLVRRDGRALRPCDGPGSACAACAGAGVRDGPAVEGALRAAGWAARMVEPERLHRAWKRLPGGIRDRVTRASPAPVRDADVRRWRAAHLALARRCAALVSPSRWLAEAAVREGLPRPEVVPHGVDWGTAGAAARPADRAEDAPFVFLGTLAPHKGPDLVLTAWRKSGVTAPLRIHGPPGPDAAWADALPHAGPLAAAEVPTLLAGARALVLGSVWPENAPLVVLEARAAGCPVIAPAIGGLPELVVPGVDGWLYPPGDVDALAAVVSEAMLARPPVRPPPPFGEHLDALLGVYDRATAPGG